MTTPFRSAADVGTAGARALPGEYYTSAEVFDRERERILSRRWVCVGRDEQLAGGRYFVRDVAGESLIVLRDQAGVLRALFNVCRHRGSRLCEQASGRMAATIQCPYHAWTYALDGRLLGAPSMEGLAGFDKSASGLVAAAAGVFEGFVFVSLAADPQPLDKCFAPLAGKFRQYQLPRLRSLRRIDYEVRANWKIVVQNYSECYHCPTVHPQLVKLSPADSGMNDLTSGPFLGGFMALPAGAALTKTGRACARDVGDLTSEDRQRVYYYSIFPNLLLSLHADYVMVHTLWPLAPDRTRVECEWLFHPDAEQQSGFDPDSGVAFWDETNRQDWHVCELSQQGASSRAYVPGPYSPRESISAAFDREVLQALAPDYTAESD